MKNLMLGLSLALLLASGCSKKSGETYQLRYKFKEGERLTETAIMKADITVSSDNPQLKAAMGNGNMGMTIDVGIDTKTSSVDLDGTGAIEQKVKKMKVTMNAMGQTMEFDSTAAAPGNFPNAQTIKQNLKKTIKSRISSLGKQQITDNALSDDLDISTTQMPVLLPEEKVYIGDEWSFNFDYPIPNLGSRVKASAVARLESIEPFAGESCAVIAMEDIRITMESSQGGQMPPGTKMEVSSEGKLLTYLGLQSGFLHKQSGTMLLKFDMSIPVNGQTNRMAMNMDMKLDYQRAPKK